MWDTEKFSWTLLDDATVMWQNGMEIHRSSSFCHTGGSTTHEAIDVTLQHLVSENFTDRPKELIISKNEKITFMSGDEKASLMKIARKIEKKSTIDNIRQAMPHSWAWLLRENTKHDYSLSASSEGFGLMIRLLLSK